MYGRKGPPAFYPPPRIACFVCGAQVPADYPLFALPPHPGKPHGLPHFPFLIHHHPPLAGPPLEEGGEAKSCRPCYTVLMSQWDDYEKNRIPLIKRVYSVKRMDGLPFPNKDLQLEAAHQVQSRVLASTTSSMMMNPGAVSTGLTSSGSAAHGGYESSDRAPPVSSPLAHHSWPPSGAPRRGLAPPHRGGVTPSAPLTLDESSVGAHALGGNGSRGHDPGQDNDSALDLSSGSRERETMKSRSSVASHLSAVSHPSSSYQSEGAGSSTDILDLTLPDKNASFEVCYVCGDEFKKGVLSHSFAKQMDKEPFYSSLLSHPRPPRSRPMDASGRVQTCDECHQHLLDQWKQFEAEDKPHSDRNYSLRKRLTPTSDNATFVCYMCALEYQSLSLRLVYVKPNAENEPYYPFIYTQKPPPGASPISPQGMVQVCTLCYKSVKETKDKLGLSGGSSHIVSKPSLLPPKKKLRYDPDSYDDVNHCLPADITCPLCRRKFSVGSFKYLHTRPPPAGGLPYFPFLVTLPKLEDFNEFDDDKQGRTRACQLCTTSLINQWSQYQKESRPISERTYTYPSLLVRPRSVSSVRAQSPASQRSSGAVTPSKSAPASEVGQATQAYPRPRSNTQESRSHSPKDGPGNNLSHPMPTSGALVSNLKAAVTSAPTCHSPGFSSVHSGHSTNANPSEAASTTTALSAQVSTATGPIAAKLSNDKSSSSASSFYCFLCGLHSELSFARMLYSSVPGKKAPYFPFLKSHVPKDRAETLREDGTALVCTFCYHSLMVQWNQFVNSKPLIEPHERKYNISEYTCYVCGITTYRKRIRALRVLDFPFLNQHKIRKGVITLESDEMVAVCLDCFESLLGQFRDGERYGIPVEKRQYNWMQIPPPPEESSSHITTPQERLSKQEFKSMSSGTNAIKTSAGGVPHTSGGSGRPALTSSSIAAATNSMTAAVVGPKTSK
ncbi:hypothetical protein TCAL_11323 [Tigriopus californicus]|uniref:Genetic suppressor element-like domain-containing protein n=1 Tax=Tigriopus californicus TaxID=6832 RepID=A0A553N9M1_TIGCA|nr:uncharacterized protein LOC131884601 [Tigriopus californicus]TRY62085.1 hypothetical protein TCAL_11323 [Tigriopus californicus]|eukprot:TCALIF_11323-PA protein Name:"Protein of unknown function" AED:0.00 eAED:0.00 QI:196/1/1/1/1/1/2/708/951